MMLLQVLFIGSFKITLRAFESEPLVNCSYVLIKRVSDAEPLAALVANKRLLHVIHILMRCQVTLLFALVVALVAVPHLHVVAVPPMVSIALLITKFLATFRTQPGLGLSPTACPGVLETVMVEHALSA